MYCQICGGNAGRLNTNNAHNLCEARKNAGLATPSLGDRCRQCNGSGIKPTANGLMLGFDLGPQKIAKAMEAIKCETCEGKGYLP